MSKSRRFLRKCAGCGTYKQKSDLIKITSYYLTGEIFINPQNSIFGRSCYICKDEKCVNNAFRKSKITKILKSNVNSEIKEKIITVLAT